MDDYSVEDLGSLPALKPAPVVSSRRLGAGVQLGYEEAPPFPTTDGARTGGTPRVGASSRASMASGGSRGAGVEAASAGTKRRMMDPSVGNVDGGGGGGMLESSSRASAGRRSARSGHAGGAAHGASRRSAASSSIASDGDMEDGAAPGTGDGEWDEDGEAVVGGRTGAPVQRRERKNVRERQRRAEVNDAFDDLTQLLRVHRKNRADKTSVLVAACVEIRALRRRLAMFEPLDEATGLYPNGSSVVDLFRAPAQASGAHASGATPSLSALAADMDKYAHSFARGDGGGAPTRVAAPAPAPRGAPAAMYHHTLLPIDETSDSDVGMQHGRHAAAAAAAAAAANVYASQFQWPGHSVPWAPPHMPGYMPGADAAHMSTLAHQMQHMHMPGGPAMAGGMPGMRPPVTTEGMVMPGAPGMPYMEMSTGQDPFTALEAWTTSHQ